VRKAYAEPSLSAWSAESTSSVCGGSGTVRSLYDLAVHSRMRNSPCSGTRNVPGRLAANRERKRAGFELVPYSAVRFNRRIVKPFEEAKKAA
jgi:hypothetical protein